jgi:CrcB protein
MREWLAIGFGGMIGSICRHGINRLLMAIMTPSWQISTLIANVIGCFLIGVAFHFSSRLEWFQGTTELAVRVGFLGGLTTFSSFSLEVVNAVQDGKFGQAIALLLANLVVGIFATVFGIMLATWFFPVPIE